MQSDGYAFNNILDTFAGADGGVKFTSFLFAHRNFQKEAANGSAQAQQILDVVEKFSKLIDLCSQTK